MKPKLQSFALTDLRLALATAFLSAVAGRLGLRGKYGSGWVKFVAYVGSVNWYLPARMVPPVAITSTILETAFGLALLAGFQIRNAALGSAGLLTLFALAIFHGGPVGPELFDFVRQRDKTFIANGSPSLELRLQVRCRLASGWDNDETASKMALLEVASGPNALGIRLTL